MKIISSVKKIAEISNREKKHGKSVGLVVGGYDVLHLGHINLFRQAKKYVDILIVGLDNDKTLKLTKGESRPINNFYRRSQFLSEISLVDYIFQIDKIFKHGDTNSDLYFYKLYKKINPTHVFTHPETDSLYKRRKHISKDLGINFIPDRTKYITTTTEILNILSNEK
ncbi:MAG: pantoate--beta-alanine ligase [Microgenomates group bacterium]